MADKADIGVMGLAVMGANLARNAAHKGFGVAVFNRNHERTDALIAEHGEEGRFFAAKALPEFIASIAKPRPILIMVKAGKPVDEVIDELLPHLEENDIIIDGGNSLFTDTARRYEACEKKKIRFLGMGVSGGEEGALKGPSLMPGGSKDAWEIVAAIFQKIAAQVEGEPCCRYMGSDGAGHYVKMVHNGIEYGDMQLICEAYAILRDVLGLEADELHEVFDNWNKGDLDSFLIEITANIFRKKDPDTGKPLVDVILDKAGQKGTGRWTLQSAIEQAVVVSTINAAVEARVLSAMKEPRVRASQQLPAPAKFNYPGDRQTLIDAVRDALYASKIISYAQGFTLFEAAGKQFNWNLNYGDIATIWRGGCIIRAKFLNRIKEAFDREPNLENLMLDPFFSSLLEGNQANWRHAVSIA